jgi:DNA-binding MarR family transcriptional regulator
MNPPRNRLHQPSGLQDMLLYRLNRLRALGGGMVLRYCEGRFGVTRREWVMVALLSDGASLQASELAVRAELSRSATSKAIASLLQKDLIERRVRAGDRRFAEINLSERGAQLYRQILPLVEGINREMMSGLSSADIAQLDRMLDRIHAQADQMWHDASGLPLADRRRGGTRRAK